VTETRYVVPEGADWAVWDDINAVLTFMTDAEAVENARENEAQLGEEFGRGLPPDPTPEQAWAYLNALWRGDPGGRGLAGPGPGGRHLALAAGRRGRSRPRRGAGAHVRVRRAAGGRRRVGGAGLLTGDSYSAG
jgi:hypothetical protein